MRENRPVSIGKLLGKSQVSHLLASASVIEKLDAIVHELIPSPLKEHCRILSVRGETLVLAADSPVWAARLRFHAPKLAKQLAKIQTVKLRTVRVRVRPPEQLPVMAIRSSKPHLSVKSSDTLRQTARNVTDPGLKAALLKLAGRN
ncbi:MAG: DUF721 domain-containing protein [Pseudomonadota bacterium]